MTLRAKVLTVSDGVAAGSRDDKSGTALVARLQDAGYEVTAHDGGSSVDQLKLRVEPT